MLGQPDAAGARPDRPRGRAGRRARRHRRLADPRRAGRRGRAGPPDRRRRARPVPRLRRTPAEVRALLPPGRVLGVIADRPLHRPQLAQIAHAARTLAAHLLVMIPVAEPGPDGLPPEALVRCDLRRPRPDAAGHDRRACRWLNRGDEIRDALLRARVAAAYGVTHLLVHRRDALRRRACGCWCRASSPTTAATASGAGATTSRRATAGSPLTAAEIDDLLDRGFAAARVAHPARRRPGAGPGPPAAPAARPRGVLHRPVRLGQVHHRPRRGRRAAARPASARSPCSTATWCAGELSAGLGFCQGRPGPQRAPDRLGGRRGRPAPAGWRCAARSRPYERPARRRGGWPGTPAPASCWST